MLGERRGNINKHGAHTGKRKDAVSTQQSDHREKKMSSSMKSRDRNASATHIA